MDTLAFYSKALAEYRAKNYRDALEIISEIEKFSPNWTKPKLLKAYIYRDQNLYVSEISTLKDTTISNNNDLMRDIFFALGVAYRNIGMSADAVKCYLASNEFDDETKTILDKLSNAIFTADNMDNFSLENYRELYHTYQSYLPELTAILSPKFYIHIKIRVGYLSADFHNHAAMHFALTLIIGLDKNKFDVYCYSSSNESDAITARIKNNIKVWRNITALSDEEAAKLIRADEIDILFDLSGHTAHNRLPIMAFRPARVQISGIGYMNSTGLNCVDYFLSDIFCAENEIAMKKHFTEKIIKLPHSHLCYAPLKSFPATADAPCLVNGYVTFGCFNNFSKVNDFILKAWQKILCAVPNSRLILKSKVFATDECKNFIAEQLLSLNFDISRVEIRGHSQFVDYLSDYNAIDIALDTYPYTGVTTTCEALYMGVPVVSLYGDHHGKRHSYSLFKNIGIKELAASNIDEYIKLAIGLAGDYKLLSILHKNLRGMMKNSPLMNQQQYLRDIENAFITIYNNS